jgi:hypothetical protein
MVLNETKYVETGVFHQVVAMIQLARLMFQGLSHLALLGKLIIPGILLRFVPVYKFKDGLLLQLI